MRDSTQSFAFVTADHPDFFRAGKTRRTVKQHVLLHAKQRRQKSSSIAKQRYGSPDSPEQPESAHVPGHPEGHARQDVEDTANIAVPTAKAAAGWSSQGLVISRHGEPPVSPLLDRFRQLPELKNQVVDLPLLLSEWFGAYGRCAPPKYLNFVIGSEMALTSYCLPVALGRSVRIQEPGRSLEYLTARQDCIRRINNALRSPNWPEETVICVKHLLFVDMYVGNRQTLRAHVNAIDKLVHLQGGLESLPLEGEIGNFLQTHVLWACVIANIRAPSALSDIKLAAVPFYDTMSPVPNELNESPLIWWSEHMSSLLNSEYSTPQLHSLTCELRDLTRTLLKFGSVPPATSNRNYRHILRHHSKSLVDEKTHLKSDLERRRIWIYESSRLAGLIYAASIVYHVPISHGASKAAIDIGSSSIKEDLGSAILKTDFYGNVPVWGALIGSYVWVALVSAAAGYHNLSGPNAQRDKALLQRAIMTQPATYTFGLFQNPSLAPNLFRSLQVMLRVQALLSTTPMPILDPSLFEDAWTPHPNLEKGSRPIDELYQMTHASCKRPDYNETRFSLPVRSQRCRSVG